MQTVKNNTTLFLGTSITVLTNSSQHGLLYQQSVDKAIQRNNIGACVPVTDPDIRLGVIAVADRPTGYWS